MKLGMIIKGFYVERLAVNEVTKGKWNKYINDICWYSTPYLKLLVFWFFLRNWLSPAGRKYSSPDFKKRLHIRESCPQANSYGTSSGGRPFPQWSPASINGAWDKRVCPPGPWHNCCNKRLVQQSCNIYRLVHGRCARTVFTHELLTYQKTNEWVFWYKNDCVNTVQSTFHVVICLFHTNWDFHLQRSYKLYLLFRSAE